MSDGHPAAGDLCVISFNGSDDVQTSLEFIFRQYKYKNCVVVLPFSETASDAHVAMWTVMYATMLFFAISGNVTVIGLVLANHRMHTVTNNFIVNLCVADLLMSILNCAFNYSYIIIGSWPFGEAYCKVNNFVANATVSASGFSLAAISSDRFMAIMMPLQRRLTKTMSVVIIAAIWTISATLSIPPFVFSTTMVKHYAQEPNRTLCYMLWPDGNPGISEMDYIYNVLFTVVAYLMPMSIMAVTYVIMGRKLWRKREIGEMTEQQITLLESKRKVGLCLSHCKAQSKAKRFHQAVKMFVVIVVLFGTCWLPYHAYFLIAYHSKALMQYKHIYDTYLFIYWFAMANAMFNPIICCSMNSRFRTQFKYMKNKLFYRKYDHSNDFHSSSTRRHTFHNQFKPNDSFARFSMRTYTFKSLPDGTRNRTMKWAS